MGQYWRPCRRGPGAPIGLGAPQRRPQSYRDEGMYVTTFTLLNVADLPLASNSIRRPGNRPKHRRLRPQTPMHIQPKIALHDGHKQRQRCSQTLSLNFYACPALRTPPRLCTVCQPRTEIRTSRLETRWRAGRCIWTKRRDEREEARADQSQYCVDEVEARPRS